MQRRHSGLLFGTLLLAALLQFAGPVFAAFYATIEGEVKDLETGKPIPECQVAIMDGENRGKFTMTDATGAFILDNVQAGDFNITFFVTGTVTEYETLTQRMRVEIGATRRMIVQMPRAGTVIEVVRQKLISMPEADSTVATTVVRMSSEELEALPLPARSYTAVLSVVPGVVESASGTHVRGGRDSEILYMVDDISITDPVTGGFGANLNFDQIESIEVIPGGMSAEYGTAMGAVINVKTKSGSENFHGKVNLSYQSDRLTDALVGNQKKTPKWLRPRTRAFEQYQPVDVDNPVYTKKDEYTWFQPDFFLEGPIWEDVITFTAGFGLLDNWRDTRYRTAPSTWEGYDGNLKVTYRVTPEDRLEFSMNKGRAEIGGSSVSFPEYATRRQTQDSGLYVLRYTHTFNERTNLTLSYQYNELFLTGSTKDEPGKLEPYEFVLVLAPSPDEPIWDYLRRSYDPNIRGPEDLSSDSLYLSGDFPFHYRRTSFRNTVSTKISTRLGTNHRVRAGFDLSDVLYNDQSVGAGYRYYVYLGGYGWYSQQAVSANARLDDPLYSPFHSGLRGPSFAGGYYEIRREAPFSYITGEDPELGSRTLTSRSNSYSAFINDSWSALPRIVISYGLRLDVLDSRLPTISGAPSGVEFPDYYITDRTFGNNGQPLDPTTPAPNPRRNDLTNIDLSPRFSLTYTPVSDADRGTVKLFANYGIFYNSSALQYITLQDAGSSYQERFTSSWSQWTWNQYQASPIRSEKTFYYQLGLDYSFRTYWSLSVHSTWKMTDDLLTFASQSTGEFLGSSAFETLRNVGESRYWGMDLIVRKDLSDNWSFRFSYTYSQAVGTLDYTDYLSQGDRSLSANQGEYYPLDWDVPHVVKISGMYDFPRPLRGLEFSWIFSYESGYPYTRFYRTPLNNTWSTIYNGSRNDARLPDRNSLDLTVGYELGIDERYNLRFYTTAYNVTNAYNVLEAYDGGGTVIAAARRRFLEFGMWFKF